MTLLSYNFAVGQSLSLDQDTSDENLARYRGIGHQIMCEEGYAWPPTMDDLTAKFNALADGLLSPERQVEVAEMIFA